MLQRYAGTVVATLAGHAHMDGMVTDEAGIRHRVCKAVLETPPGRRASLLVLLTAAALLAACRHGWGALMSWGAHVCSCAQPAC